jgi:predicted nucleic acid-binding protein
MILVDSGVLIDFLRTKSPKLKSLFRALPVGVCGATRAEILSGARGGADRHRLVQFLAQFSPVPSPETIWDLVGDNLATLLSSGITVPFPDIMVVTLAIQNSFEVWARDAHFPMMQKVLPQIKLFQEPP